MEMTPRYCIIIPTYNNHKTLKRVIDGVLNYISAQDIIIVNDGSTDTTPEILKAYSDTTQIHHSKNQGKGMALRNGFKKALALGYTHALTIDSDGQHFPSDIPSFINYSKENPNLLLIGARNMEHEDVPNKSSFGNKFSNFWFWFETGIKLRDTQSGFRLYPLYLMPKKWYSTKFEFEIEVIVRSAWNDIPVENIPIKVSYDKEERVTHFRPFKDFTRISIVNTILVTLLFFYIFPRKLIRNFQKKKFKDFVKEDLLGSDDSPKVKALSLALGVFIGILPIWGFQTVIALFLAVTFRLNKVLTFAASNISIPPMIPLIVFAALKIGSTILGRKMIAIDFTSLESLKNHFLEYIVGSVILAIFAALFVGLISFITLKYLNKKKNYG